MKPMKNNFGARWLQFARFLLVGTTSTVIGLATFTIVHLVGGRSNAWLAVIVSYFVSSVVGFFLNRRWVFDGAAVHARRTFIKFQTIGVPMATLNSVSVQLFVNAFEVNAVLVQAVFVLVISAPVLFLLNQYFVFSKK